MPSKKIEWPAEADQLLRSMAKDGMLANQISRRMARSKGAVVDRARLLGVQIISLREWRLKRSLPSSGQSNASS